MNVTPPVLNYCHSFRPNHSKGTRPLPSLTRCGCRPRGNMCCVTLCCSRFLRFPFLLCLSAVSDKIAVAATGNALPRPAPHLLPPTLTAPAHAPCETATPACQTCASPFGYALHSVVASCLWSSPIARTLALPSLKTTTCTCPSSAAVFRVGTSARGTVFRWGTVGWPLASASGGWER
jgi:hypothetical protein